MLFKLMIPENFEIRFPNYFREKVIPTYHERVLLPSNGIVITRDIRVKEALERLGLLCIFSSGIPTRSASPEEESLEEESGDMIMIEDIEELEGPNLDYCKYCGKGFEEVTKEHVETEHNFDWEEYERLPEMVPPLALKIYWASNELQEAFSEPLNLLCSHNMYANFLDWIKQEGTRRYKVLADYYGVPFNPGKRATVYHPEEKDFEEYCKICGAKATSIESHIVGHGIPMVEYRKLARPLNDLLLDFYFKHSDLQRAFPNPVSNNCKHGVYSSYLDWCKTQGVKSWPILRNFFKGKEIENT